MIADKGLIQASALAKSPGNHSSPGDSRNHRANWRILRSALQARLTGCANEPRRYGKEPDGSDETHLCRRFIAAVRSPGQRIEPRADGGRRQYYRPAIAAEDGNLAALEELGLLTSINALASISSSGWDSSPKPA